MGARDYYCPLMTAPTPPNHDNHQDHDPDPILCDRCGTPMRLIGPHAAHQLPYFKCPRCGRRA